MHVKFRIIFEDDTIAESHDEMYNWLYDHAHFLPPNVTKQWKEYWLISDEGHRLGVNFKTGLFFLQQRNIPGDLGLITITPKDAQGNDLSHRSLPQHFPNVTKQWQGLNGLPYFPVVGRRHFKGDWGETMSFFCGWKIALGEKKEQLVSGQKQKSIVQLVYHVLPDGNILPELS